MAVFFSAFMLSWKIMITLLLESLPLIYMIFMGDRTRKITSYMVLILLLESMFSIFLSPAASLIIAYSASLLLVLPNAVRKSLYLTTWIMLCLTLIVRGLYDYWLFIPLLGVCLVMIFKREHFSLALSISAAFMFTSLLSEIYFLTTPLSIMILVLFTALAAYMQSSRKKEKSTT